MSHVVTLKTFELTCLRLLEYTFDPENNLNTDAVQTSQTPPPVGPLNGPGQPQFIHSGRVHPIPRALQSVTTMLSLLSIVWFIASHVLVYTSLNTCRQTSPHLWYLTFGIMSIAYLLIAEVLAVILFLFFFVPMLLVRTLFMSYSYSDTLYIDDRQSPPHLHGAAASVPREWYQPRDWKAASTDC